MDWFLLRIPPHLHLCTKKVPLSKLDQLADSLFEEPSEFILEWKDSEADVIAALELLSIASFAKVASSIDSDDSPLWNSYTCGTIGRWKLFVETATRLSLEALAKPDVLKTHKRFMPSISSIEVSCPIFFLFVLQSL